MTTSNEVLKDFQSNMAVGIGKLGNPTLGTAKCNVTVKHNVGS